MTSCFHILMGQLVIISNGVWRWRQGIRNDVTGSKSAILDCFVSSPPGGVKSFAIRVFVYLSVCPLTYPQNHCFKFHKIFCTLLVTMAWSSSDENAIRCVLPVLWMTLYFHIMEWIGQNQRRRVCFVQFAGWRCTSHVRRGCLVEFAKCVFQNLIHCSY